MNNMRLYTKEAVNIEKVCLFNKYTNRIWSNKEMRLNNTKENNMKIIKKEEKQKRSNLYYALKYAEIGLSVFPLVPNSKKPATKDGFKSATNDSKQIKSWWKSNPDYNIGIATGQDFGGYIVIDLDNHGDINGLETLQKWEAENEPLPPTLTAITGSGGRHLIYKSDVPIKNKVNLYPGIDIRGDGGYIVAPPSVHPDTGDIYKWLQENNEIAEANSVVMKFLEGASNQQEKAKIEPIGEVIPEGKRTDYLFKMLCGLQKKGLTDSAIIEAVKAENESKCTPPLTDLELEREVFPALKRYQKGDLSNTIKPYDYSLISMDKVHDKEIQWLIAGYIPRGQITVMAGDGGIGKTSMWCAIAAAVSRGDNTFLIDEDKFHSSNGTPETILFFSGEDQYEYTLRKKLEANGANLDKILSMHISDKRFKDLKLNSPELEGYIKKYRPALVIIDPIQSFLHSSVNMASRNAMRNNLEPLIAYGETYDCAFLLIVHTNKQTGVWGRKRISDSSDIWDCSRSVLMLGETNDRAVKYMSHEKNNYGALSETILFGVEGNKIKFSGYTSKKDRDFVQETSYEKSAPKRDEAKAFILDTLKAGEMPVKELDNLANAIGISKKTLRNAKKELKENGEIFFRTEGHGKCNGTTTYISLQTEKSLLYKNLKGKLNQNH